MTPPARRHWLFVGVGALAAAAGAGWHLLQQRSVALRPRVAEHTWSLRFERPAGGTLDMAALRGRPLLINFWATWCPPCIKEMPQLDRFWAAHGNRVRVIGLAIDNPTPVREFLTRQPVRFDIGLAAVAGSTLASDLGNKGGVLPFTVLLDADGALVRHKTGETSMTELVDWLRLL